MTAFSSSNAARASLLALGMLSATTLVQAQLRLPESSVPAPAPQTAPQSTQPQWLIVHQSSYGRLELNRASLMARDHYLGYQTREGAGSPVRWVSVRCDLGTRAELQPESLSLSGQTSASPSTERLRDTSLAWRRPEFGSRDEAECLLACDLARRSNLRVDAIPDWQEQEVEALAQAWQHTSGGNAFDWRVAYFDSAEAAQRGRVMRWGPGTAQVAIVRHAASLMDVPLPLRQALQDLWEPKARSAVLSTQGVDGQPLWAVVELVKRSPVERASSREAFLRQAAGWVAQARVESPQALLASAEHQARVAFWPAQTPEAVQAAAARHSPNIRFGDGFTPLTWAVLRRNWPLVKALLANGASPDLCGQLGCALQMLGMVEDPSTRAQLLEDLLAAGAKPDAIDTRFRFAGVTALGEAVFKGDVATAKRLRAAGASPDGVPGVRMTPLEQALAGGHRELAQWLLDEGANVLPWSDRSVFDPGSLLLGRGNAWLATSEHPEMRAWIEDLMLRTAAKRADYQVQLSIEQDGKRQKVTDGAVLNLRAAPLRLIFRLPGGTDQSVTLTASLHDSFAQQAKRNSAGNGALVPSRSGALSDTPSPGSFSLPIYEPPSAQRKADEHWGGHVVLHGDDKIRRDFHRRNGNEFTREVSHLFLVPNEGSVGADRPLAELKGQTLNLVFGSSLVLDPIEWAPWVNVQSVSLRLR